MRLSRPGMLCLTVLCIAALAGCSGGGGFNTVPPMSLSNGPTTVATPTPLVTPTPTVVSIVVSPSELTLPIGATKQLDAVATFSDGSAVDITSSATWTSSAASVTVTSTGIAQSVSVGQATISAASEGVSGTSIVTASALQPVSIKVTPSGSSIHDVEDTLQLTATATFSNGTTSNVTDSVTWSVSGSVPGTVSASGLFRGAGTPGSATVGASLSGLNGQTTVTLIQGIYVLDKGLNKVFRVDNMDGAGFVAVGPAIAFNNPSYMTVNTAGNILVADAGNGRIVELSGVANATESDFTNFSPTLGLFTDSQDRIYVTNGSAINLENNLEGSGLLSFSGDGAFNETYGVYVDASGHIFMTDFGNNNIYELDSISGSGFTTLTTGGFNAPDCIQTDSTGHIYVADLNNARIVQLANIAGDSPVALTTTGATGPLSVALDAAGNIYYTTLTGSGGQVVRVSGINGANATTLTGTDAVTPYFVFVR